MQSDPHLRYVIIGAAASIAVTHIAALQKLGASIVGLSDPNLDAVKVRAQQIGCPAFADHHALFAAVQADVAVICAPHPFHVPIAVDCFAVGLHVLTEKPMAIEVAEADKAIDAAEKANRLMAVNFQSRLRPSVEYVKQFIAAGELGGLVRTLVLEPWLRTAAYYRSSAWRGTWRGEGGGVLMNQAPHTLDLMCHLVGLPTKVWGWVRTRFQSMECEDTAQAMLEYSNGAPGYFTTSTAEAGGQRRLEIIGERAAIQMIGDTITIQRFAPSLTEFIANDPNFFSSPTITTETLELPTSETQGNHYAVYKDLESAIAEGRQPRCNGVEGRMSLELANVITLSSFSGAPVSLPLDRAAYHAFLIDQQHKGR
ncbi:MAG: Gfo/Idh/MocA family protein [Aggregatilineales bacterium]